MFFKKNSIKFYDNINSIIGEGITVKGEIFSEVPFRIDGKFIGKVVSNNVVYIGKTGVAECNLISKDIIVGGTIKGNIYAENSLIILKTAEIFGNIYTTSIKMDDGVIFDGECNVLSKDEMKKLIEIKTKEPYSII